jgi:hypothetical protein
VAEERANGTEIDNLCGKNEFGEYKACFAGNEHLAIRLHVSASHMRDMLADLTSRGYILRLEFTGRGTVRCINPEISSDPRCVNVLLKKYGKNRYRKNPIAAIGQNLEQTSDKSDTEIPSRDTNKRTTTSGSCSVVKNGAGASDRSSSSFLSGLAAAEESEDRQAFDNCLVGFFGLSDEQTQLTQGNSMGYLRQWAEKTLEQRRRSPAAYFISCVSKGHQISEPNKVEKAAAKPKRIETASAKPDPRKEMTDEEIKSRTTPLREFRGEQLSMGV